MARSEKQKMLAGEPYRPRDPELQAELAANKVWLASYNATLASSPAERRELGAGLLARDRVVGVGREVGL
jgi:maltose O-acetyltransferase